MSRRPSPTPTQVPPSAPSAARLELVDLLAGALLRLATQPRVISSTGTSPTPRRRARPSQADPAKICRRT